MAYINGKNVPLSVNITGIVNVDEHYDPTSENPQAGTAVSEAFAEKFEKYEYENENLFCFPNQTFTEGGLTLEANNAMFHFTASERTSTFDEKFYFQNEIPAGDYYIKIFPDNVEAITGGQISLQFFRNSTTKANVNLNVNNPTSTLLSFSTAPNRIQIYIAKGQMVEGTDINIGFMLSRQEPTEFISVGKTRLKAEQIANKSITADKLADGILPVPKEPYKSNTIIFDYPIDDVHYTRGFLKLPRNYTTNGKSVPLIVAIHGSSQVNFITSTEINTVHEPYYNYLNDCGYAVFDCYGWGNKYSDITSKVPMTSTWGAPTNTRCYIKGIEYVIDKYNIDSKNIFTTCKSLGGLQAFALCYQNSITIKACGMLAPQLNLMTYPFGFNPPERKILPIEFEFTGDWQSVLDVSNEVYDHAVAKNYLRTQSKSFSKYDPTWFKFLADIDTKFNQTIDQQYNKDDCFKLCDVPIKIWCAPDDRTVHYELQNSIIKQLQNSGCKAEMRTMPENTGGHHATDNDPNALKETDVTTSLGIHYDSVPTAYYELREYFDSYYYG